MKLGIIGTGRIAERFVKTALVNQKDVVISCVYNPRKVSAESFAKSNEINEFTDDLNVFVKSVDAVYIASPHETHFGYAKKMLESGKHVLCEKPLALSGCDAKELFGIADEKELVLMEAIKTAYCPGFISLLKEARSGKIGEVIDVEAAFTRLTPTNVREQWDMEYGGSFMEFGSYVLMPAMKLLGTEYNDVQFKSVPTKIGLDGYTKCYLEYDGKMATGKCGMNVKSEGQLLVSGTKGYILAQSPWWMTKRFEIRYEDPSIREVYEFEYNGSGLQYEVDEFIRKIEGMKNETNGVRKEESIAIAEVFERFLDRRKEAIIEIEQKENVNIEYWAHRGCSFRYPENTLAAFKAAADIEGLKGIELDVQLTADGEVIVYHDEKLKRLFGTDKKIVELTYDDLKKYTFKMNEGCEYIPTLKEVLKLLQPYCYKSGLLINIELKTSVERYAGIEKKVLDMVKEFSVEEYVVYSSFLPESIELVKEIEPTAKTGVLAGSLSDCIKYARETKADALHPWLGGLDCDIPDDMKNMPVRCWGANEPFYKETKVLKKENFEKYNMVYGVSEMITNVPEEYINNIL